MERIATSNPRPLPGASSAAWTSKFTRQIAFAVSLAFLFVIPLENAILLPGVGRLSRLAGLVLAGVWAAAVVHSRQLRKLTRFHGLLFLFVAWNAASMLWTVDLERTVERSETWLQLAMMVVILWDLHRTGDQIRWALQTYVAGTFTAAIWTTLNFLAGEQSLHGRFTAANLHVDDLGIILALGIPVAWFLLLTGAGRRPWRYLWSACNLLYLPVALIAIGLSGTRAAVVASVPSVLFIIFSSWRLPRVGRLSMLGMALLTVVAVTATVPPDLFDRLQTIDEEITSGDLNGRRVLWREGMVAFAESPLLGVGSSAFRTAIRSTEPAHNTILSVLVEAGVIGAALFLAILIDSGRALLQLPRRQAAFWLTIAAVWGLGAFTLTWEQKKQTWLFLTLLQASAAAVVWHPDHGAQAIASMVSPSPEGAHE